MKKCNKCNENKDLTEYKNDPRNRDGKQGICTSCIRLKEAQRRAIRMATAPSLKEKTCTRCKACKSTELFFKDSGISDGFSTICKDCRNVSMNKWREENREKYNAGIRRFRSENKEWAKENDLQRTHGISLEDYNNMLKDQNHLCKICRKAAKGKRPLAVDHDHATGEIRGLLCYGCNRALHTLDNKELLAKALAYLKK